MAGKGLQPAIIGINALCPVLSGFVVAARFYQKRSRGKLAAEDWLILAAWLLSINTSVLTAMFSTTTYQGYRDQDIPRHLIDWEFAGKIRYSMTVSYNPILVMVKASFLWSLQKLESPRVWVRRSLWLIQGINFAYGIAHFLSSAMVCIPVRKTWDPKVPGTCQDQEVFIIWTICMVLATDIMVLAMPTWIIYDLNSPRNRKILAISFLSLGLILIAVGGLRMWWLVRVTRRVQSMYAVYPSLSAIEVSVAIIAASGPTVKWLLSFLIPALRSDPQRKQASAFKPSVVASSAKRSARSKESRYYGLETDKGDETISQDEITLVPWDGGKHEGSAHSEETRGTVGDDGILKTFSVSQTRRDVV